MTKVRLTIVGVSIIKQGDEIIGRTWTSGPSIGLNPAHLVSQVPFTWSDTDGNSVSGLEVRTVLGDKFYIDTKIFI